MIHALRSTVLLSALTASVVAQGCSDRCPPLDGAGNPVPSLCPSNRVPSAYLTQSHAVCWPPPSRAPSAVSLSDFMAADTNGDKIIDGRDVGSQQLRVVVVSLVYTGCNAGRREAEQFQDLASAICSLWAPLGNGGGRGLPESVCSC